MTTSNEHSNAPAVPQEEGRPGIPLRKAYKHLLIVAPAQEFNKSVADAEIKAMYVESQGSDKGWLGIEGSYFIGGVVAARKQKAALAPAQGEPFGYFRAEPFGWTDCAEDDEGAIALYERPQEVVIPQGYEIHELPHDYSGPVWIESQVRQLARQNACASQPTTDTGVVEDVYAQGWIAAAGWAMKPDLIADVDSPAYTNERDGRLMARGYAARAKGGKRV